MKKVLLILFFLSSNCFALPLYHGWLNSCDANGDGVEVFNLSNADNHYFNNVNLALYDISYYYNPADASAGTGAILDFTNFVSSSTIIYVRVVKISDGEWGITQLHLGVRSFPIFNQPDDVIQVQNPYTGFSVFNLETVSASITLAPSTFISYHETIVDAELNENPIVFSCAYSNLTPSQTIYVRVANQYCFSVTSFIIGVISGTPTPSPVINFTDVNFKNKLLQADINNLIARNLCTDYASSAAMKIDKNNDGEIQESEALQVGGLYLDNSNIADLEGLQYFSNLTQLYIEDNQISNIDVSMLPKLNHFFCSGNLITTLDVSENPELCSFSCTNSPNLVSVFMKNGGYGCPGEFLLLDNPLLEYVCTDEDEVSQQLINFNLSNMPDVIVNSYCSFVPSGDYNTITGTTKFDAGNDGCDTSDFPTSFVKIMINDGQQDGTTFVNGSGIYSYYTQAGTYNITTVLENPSFFNVAPVTASVTFPDTNNSVSTNDFCITANGIHPDLEIVNIPLNWPRPGENFTSLIMIRNKGNQTQSGNFSLSFEDVKMNFMSATVPVGTQNVGVLNWDFANLHPFESRSIEATFLLNSPTDVPPINNLDQLIFGASINPISGDFTPNDNFWYWPITVFGSYDPNDKQCLEGETVVPEKIGDYLHYLIRFENTGNDYAQNIVVKDVIDETKFDVSSLQILSSSHPMDAKITGNKAEFIFKDINLNAGAHGNLVFKIKTKPTLTVGTTVSNKADIYFDYNYPIITNFANTTFQLLSVPENELDQSVSIYPNPTSDLVSVKANSVIRSIQVYDFQGRILLTKLLSEENASVDFTTYASGIYYLKIDTEKGSKTEKLVKK